MKEIPFRSKEESWLSFNLRVLDEANSPNVPLIERLRFLGIYSNNLDEFFRVRIATLRRLVLLGAKYKELNIPNPSKTLKKSTKILIDASGKYNEIYFKVVDELKKEGIMLINNDEIPEELKSWVFSYYQKKIKPYIMPIIIKKNSHLFGLKDILMYLAVRLSKKSNKGRSLYALLEIPQFSSRFITLPDFNDKKLVMYIDDIIRFALPDIFNSSVYDKYEAFAVKFTRDAEIELDNDITESIFEKISEGLKARDEGKPIRINYDSAMPKRMLRVFQEKLNLPREDSLYPGARYHNRKDLINFPSFNKKGLCFDDFEASRHSYLNQTSTSFIQKIKKSDILLHFPYHPFDHFLDFLREVSIDPLVKSIKITQYRIAKNSAVARALINAVRNGKRVQVVVEPRARFDEKANIAWANEYQSAGINVGLGVPGLKVHAKLCLISRNEAGNIRYYSALSTGNFNESTADKYTDHMLFTANQEIGKDVEKSFRYFHNNFKPPKLRHLVASPFTLRPKIRELIAQEIKNAKKGKKACIKIKINNLSDEEIISDLYNASKNGVKIKIIARSMFSLVLDDGQDYCKNIEAISIVDRFLEHTRFVIFNNDDNPLVYISSADFLPRNFDGRYEIMSPIYEKKLQKQIIDYFKFQWNDSVKARRLDLNLTNTFRGANDSIKGPSAQEQIAKYVADLNIKS